MAEEILAVRFWDAMTESFHNDFKTFTPLTVRVSECAWTKIALEPKIPEVDAQVLIAAMLALVACFVQAVHLG